MLGLHLGSGDIVVEKKKERETNTKISALRESTF